MQGVQLAARKLLESLQHEALRFDSLARTPDESADTYSKSLGVLTKICGNLNKSPVNPKHLRLNLQNAKLHALLGRFGAAVRLLELMGFEAEEAGSAVLVISEAAVAQRADTLADLLGLLRSAGERRAEYLAEQERAAAIAADVQADTGFDHSRETDAAERAAHAAKVAQREAEEAAVRSVFDEPVDVDPATLSGPSAPVVDLSMLSSMLTRERFGGVSDEEYVGALRMITTVGKNLRKDPPKEAYRTIPLTNAKFHQACGRFPAAIEYIKQYGFHPEDDKLVLSPDDEDLRRVERVQGIANRILTVAAKPKIDRSPIPRNLVVMRPQPVQPKPAPSPTVVEQAAQAAAEEDAPVSDALVLRAWRENQRRLEEQQRFVIKSKVKEERERNRPRYEKTVQRINFGRDVIVQAEFNPHEPAIQALCTTVEGLLREDVLEAKRAAGHDYRLRQVPNLVIVPPYSEAKKKRGPNVSVKKREEKKKKQEASFTQMGLVPASSLMFYWTDGDPTPSASLKPETLAQVRDFQEVEVPKAINRESSEQGSSAAEAAPDASKKKRKPPSEADIEAAMLARMGFGGARRKKSDKKQKKGSSSSSSSSSSSGRGKKKGARSGKFDIRSALGNRRGQPKPEG